MSPGGEPPLESRRVSLDLIAIEGPNGAGKSSVARHLTREFAGQTLRYSAAFMRLRESLDLDRTVTPKERLMLYLAAIDELSDRCLATGGVVVLDRYFASPLALMEVDGSLAARVIDDVAAPVLERIAVPTLTLLLTADRQTLRRRLSPQREFRRGLSFESTFQSDTFSARLTDAIRRRLETHGEMVEIDTTMLTEAQLYATINDAVRPRLSMAAN